jgi:perosamine synthetase
MNARIPIAEPQLGDEELRNVTEAIQGGWISSKGAFIEEFENNFSAYIGAKHGVSTSNGTAALHLALIALGIGKGDKVLVPSLTFAAVANAVLYVGAEPVFLDSAPDYWCLDPSGVEKKIDKFTKAIIVVHIYGHPCEMRQIQEIAEKHKLLVIEDCAEAHGAEYCGQKVGSFGIISCFSFYGNKIITTGEGGMCLTNDHDLKMKMRMFRDHGMNPQKKYWHDVIGFNYRMTNMQAAVGVAQLKKINKLIRRKIEVAHAYRRLLTKMPEVTAAPEMPWAKSVFWLYSILVNPLHRDKIIELMGKNGIETRPFFYPCHIMPPYNKGLSLPVAEDLSSRGMNLPSAFRLTSDDIDCVVESLSEATKKAKNY